MDLKQIKELMAAMEKAGLKKIRIKEEKGFELEIVKSEEQAPIEHAPRSLHMNPPLHEHFTHAPPPPLAHRHGAAEEKKEHKPGKHVTSPMVGTFYASASPDDPNFVKVGDRVEEDTILCIIEAMKVMNEVKAGMSGVVAEMMVENAHPVEFGTKLFRIT